MTASYRRGAWIGALGIGAALGCGSSTRGSPSSSAASAGASGSGGSSSGLGGRSSASSGSGGGSSASSGSGGSTGSSTTTTSSTGSSSSSSSGGGSVCAWRADWVAETVSTPFAAPNDSITFTFPAIPCAIFPITDHGAVAGATPAGGAAVNTQAFASTVAAAVAAGGGVVDVPPGTWLTGAIHLASKVDLHLEAGATVLFSQSTGDYLPPVLTRWEGLDVMNFSPFVYALNAHDVAVTGPGPSAASPGVLDGQGSSWWSWRVTSAAEDMKVYAYYVGLLKADGTLPNTPLPAPPTSAKSGGLRPALVECNGCTTFLVDGIQTQNPAYWGLHPLYSTNVILRNSNLTSNPAGANGDGIDVDSCKDVLIEDDTFATSDDVISLKSGLNEDGIAVGKPTEEVVVRDVRATAGHALSLGSEMSGGITNVYVTAGTANTLDGMQYLLSIKTLPGRGGTVQNIWFTKVTGTDWSKYAVDITDNYAASTIPPHNPNLLPHTKNVTFENVTGKSSTAPALNLVGLGSAPFQSIAFDGVTLSGQGTNGCMHVSGVTLTGSTISGVTGAAINCP